MKDFEEIIIFSNYDSNVDNTLKIFEVEMYLDRDVGNPGRVCVIFSDFIILILSLIVIRFVKTLSWNLIICYF